MIALVNNRIRRLLAVWALVPALLMIAPSAAGDEPVELPPGGTFVDDDGLPQEGYIEALAATGVTKGCNPPDNDRFCPGYSVTRGQTASFLVRALGLPSSDVDQFLDDDESPHEGDINALVAAGITKGCDPPDNTKFCPTRAVTRGEMAAFLVRAFGYESPPDVDTFTDDDYSVFEADIEALAAAGITKGCGEARFCPESAIKRSNLAVFLVRALGLDVIIPPPRPRVIGEFTTYHKCCESRVTNIHLIADAVDGVVVPAGETWSLNGHVGQRTEAKGYVPAGAIVAGELVAEVGGGTSQFATTIYNAIFFSGLEDVYHRPHSVYFSRYPLGREATLGWTLPDIVFRNDTEYPVTIDTSYTSTSITVKMIGENGGREVSTTTTGSATTSGGGSATVTRTIDYPDGTSTFETWTHRYNPLITDPDPPPPPPPPPPPEPL
ncbi:MAG: VanW family protein [Acidimicrobiia bacterium]|nr:VanW family protein [Acidimicrobiia bacterium]